MLRTILALVVSGLFELVIGLPLLLVAWIRGTAGPLYPVVVTGLRLAFAVAGLRIRLEGAENIPPGSCLFMSNHTSTLDPMAVFISAPRRIAFMAKKELFEIPFLGLSMRSAQFISVDRSNREAAAASANRAVSQLCQGVSLVIYPEGTRSPDGRLLPFKRGAFLIAIRAGRPVVPMTITGAERALSKGERWIRPGEIVIRFHPAMDVSGYAEDDRELLRERVRAAIAAGLPPALR
ncbi:MAG TPA: lysophospholipid acyltransferase family protein [Candidatus Dormibacteraeota bacterium]|nr:lysophospholipid acyltransferase family protein [Candidatus Dormibacteraeota bacterium]